MSFAKLTHFNSPTTNSNASPTTGLNLFANHTNFLNLHQNKSSSSHHHQFSGNGKSDLSKSSSSSGINHHLNKLNSPSNMPKTLPQGPPGSVGPSGSAAMPNLNDYYAAYQHLAPHHHQHHPSPHPSAIPSMPHPGLNTGDPASMAALLSSIANVSLQFKTLNIFYLTLCLFLVKWYGS